MSADYSRLALDTLHHGVCLFDEDGRVLAVNRQFALMYNFEPAAVDNAKTLREYLLLGQETGGGFKGDANAYVDFLLHSMREGRTLRAELEYGDGRIFRITDKPTGSGGWLSTHEDVTERVIAERQVAYLAEHDLLTGLPNRAQFQECLANAIADCATRSEQFALVCIDFDY